MTKTEKLFLSAAALSLAAAIAVTAASNSRRGDVSVSSGEAYPAEAAVSAKPGAVNINTATKEELCTLPGVGEATAEKIIAWREKYGAFRDTSDIIDVKGIGEAAYEKLRDLITV